MTDQQTQSREMYEDASGWVGWIAFAAVMMIIGGSLNLMYGIIALVNDTWVGWNEATSSAVLIDLTSWGWAHIILGACLLLAGIGVLSGNILARTIGVIVAGVNMIGNFFFIPVHPIWSIIIIVIDILVIYALTAHGSEMKRG